MSTRPCVIPGLGPHHMVQDPCPGSLDPIPRELSGRAGPRAHTAPTPLPDPLPDPLMDPLPDPLPDPDLTPLPDPAPHPAPDPAPPLQVPDPDPASATARPAALKEACFKATAARAVTVWSTPPDPHCPQLARPWRPTDPLLPTALLPLLKAARSRCPACSSTACC